MTVPFDLAIAIVALGVEACFGYPDAIFRRVGHPVTWIGAWLAWLDRRFNLATDPPRRRRWAGGLALGVLLLGAGLLSGGLQAVVVDDLPRLGAIVALGFLASPCLAQRSLDEHVRAVRDALRHDGLDAGRTAVSMIVGRDTATLDASGVARAAIESLAENFSDGIVAPALYVAIGGLPGGVLYKAVNTADSMIGHRTPRHEAFGFAAAKLDDGVNWPAARLAGVWIVIAAALTRGASARAAWRVMRRDARGHSSPNAGWPEAAMAGALGITLGGPRAYGGTMIDDATMGDGAPADCAALTRALTLYRRACACNAAAIAVVAAAIALWP